MPLKLPVQIPASRIHGPALRAIAAVADKAPVSFALRLAFSQQLGIDALSDVPDSERGAAPAEARPISGRPPRAGDDHKYDAPAPPAAWPRSSAAYAARYKSGLVSPRQVAEASLKAARELAGRLGGPAICLYDDEVALAAADESTARWKAGVPRGPLDGVPTVIKEQTAMAGLPVRAGTAFLHLEPAARDASIVARLRAAGAVVLGSSVMTEYGMSPIGLNPQRAMPRNPHREGHVAGGSSTGSGVAVATGVCPVALGNDGGGSIRIPSSLCGVFGLKATFGRISRAGDTYGGTMATMGPMGASTTDLGAFLDVIAGVDDADPLTRWQPAPRAGEFSAALGRGVKGLRIGVWDHAFEGAQPAVAQSCRAALAVLEKAGATLVPVALPLGPVSPAIGYLSIGLEALAGMRGAMRTHKDAFGKDFWISMSTLGAFSATDYLDAQMLRTRLREQVAAVYRDVDLLAMPATATTAPAFDEEDARGGLLDAAALHGLCRTTMLGNLTGLPAGSAPVGRDADFLPIGLQLMGDAWDEATVLAAMAQLERDGAATVIRPRDAAASPAGW